MYSFFSEMSNQLISKEYAYINYIFKNELLRSNFYTSRWNRRFNFILFKILIEIKKLNDGFYTFISYIFLYISYIIKLQSLCQ